MSQLETEISTLLGSIKVRASSIKQSLKKQQSTLNDDNDEGEDTAPIELSDVKIQVEHDSMSEVVNDGHSNNDSFVSMIKAHNDESRDDDDSRSDVKDKQVVEDKTNLTLPVSHIEIMLSELKTKHIAEKRMLQCDLSLCKKVIQLMSKAIRSQKNELWRKDIYLKQFSKLQAANRDLSNENK